jgi:hypothetical protein
MILRLTAPSPWSLTTFAVSPIATSLKVLMFPLLYHDPEREFLSDRDSGFLHIDNQVSVDFIDHGNFSAGHETEVSQMLADFIIAADFADFVFDTAVCYS